MVRQSINVETYLCPFVIRGEILKHGLFVFSQCFPIKSFSSVESQISDPLHGMWLPFV